MAKQYWLMKSEPDVFGIDHLAERPKQTEHWDGVRNYQARNLIRDEMAAGQLALFYHSNCKEPGVVGLMEISSDPYPDPVAEDPDSKYYDPKHSADQPRWYVVDVTFREKFPQVVTLAQIKADKTLAQMKVAQKGNRLSITPVTKAHFDKICRLGSGE